MIAELKEETTLLQRVQDEAVFASKQEVSAGQRDAELTAEIAVLEGRIAALRQADVDDAAAEVQAGIDRVAAVRAAREAEEADAARLQKRVEDAKLGALARLAAAKDY